MTRLTILDAAPHIFKLRAFVEAKIPALQVVELDGRCDMMADLELLRDRVELCFAFPEGMGLDIVLGRMKAVNT